MANPRVREPMNERELTRFRNFAKKHSFTSFDEIDVRKDNTLLAFIGNKLVGGLNFTPEIEDKNFSIDLIGVHPDHHHKHIGKKLMQKLEELAIRKGIETLDLISLNGSDVAENFHRNMGFKSTLNGKYMVKEIKSIVD